MLSATEFYEVSTPLLIVLWLETVIYLGIGLYETFDDFIHKTPKWAYINDRLNSWIWFQDKVGHKMHAAICFMLGFVALNGALEGMVTRFEIEIIFVSFALISGMVFGLLPPGRFGLVTIVTKPEIILQIVMYVFCVHLIRPEIIALCVLLNLWGVFVYFRQTSKIHGGEFAILRADMVEAGFDEKRLETVDKLVGYQQQDVRESGSGPVGS